MEELKDLRDIRGLDTISNWPLAWGWWILISCAIVIAFIVGVKLYRTYKFRRSWRYGVYTRLASLQAILLTTPSSKQVLQSLAVQLRKIGLETAERNQSASLIGHEWLAWLQQRDPNGFSWSEHGEVLVNAQYQQQLENVDQQQVVRLINAAQKWVQKC